MRWSRHLKFFNPKTQLSQSRACTKGPDCAHQHQVPWVPPWGGTATKSLFPSFLLPLDLFFSFGRPKKRGWEILPKPPLKGFKLKLQKLGNAGFMEVRLTLALPPFTLRCSV